MIDIHSHLVYGVDDGPSTIEESVKMVYEAEEIGIKTIITTPHFQENLTENRKVVEHFNELVYRTRDCDITLKMGYEVPINPFLPLMIKERDFLMLDNSRYILLELPFNSMPIYTRDIIYKLQLENVIPIIAHPERNGYFSKNPDLFFDLVNRGCMVQIDAGSIMGIYGDHARRFAQQLMEKDLAGFVASDAHSRGGYSTIYLKAYQRVVKLVDEEQASILFNNNAESIFINRLNNIKQA